MKYTTYIFDLDGTLLDTLEDLTASVNAALNKYHMKERTLEEIRSFVGNGIGKLVERSVPDGVQNPLFENVFEAFKEHYKEHCADKTAPYEGVVTLLDKLLKNGKKIGIVSNKADFAVKELRDIYFKDMVEIAIGEKENIHRKPAPDTVFEAMKELESVPEECVYIGDSEVDIKTAKNAGIPCISVLWGFRDHDFLVSEGGKVFAENPEDVLRLTEVV